MRSVKMLILIWLTGISFILGGCGFRDIDKRYFVVAIGIDQAKDTNKYIVSLKLANPSPESQKKQQNFEIKTAEADTIAIAVSKIKSNVGLELEFGQAKVIIFGESLVRKNLKPVIDWTIRRRDIQKIAYVTVGHPDAGTILRLKPKSERLPGNNIYLALDRTGTASSYITSVKLSDFYRKATEKGLDPMIPIIEIKDNDFLIHHAAILEKEKALKVKMVLSPDETLIYNMISQNFATQVLSIQTGEMDFVTDLTSLKSKYDIVSAAGSPKEIRMDVQMEGVIEESHHEGTEHSAKYEQAVSEVMTRRIQAFLNKVKSANLDPVGFGLRYRSRSIDNVKEWAVWQQAYPDIKIRVNVQYKLKNAGLILG